MSLLFLYDSEEWSNHYLISYLRKNQLPVKAVNFEKETLCFESFENIILTVNRLFPSAYFRGHYKTHYQAEVFMESLHQKGVSMINSYESFTYDFSKTKTSEKLQTIGLLVPDFYGCSSKYHSGSVRYPCMIKPDQGGRSFNTHIVDNEHQLEVLLDSLPPVEYIIQEYIKPDKPCTLRVEIVGGKILSVFERTTNDQGLSAYSRGSSYKKTGRLSSQLANDCQKVMSALNLRMASFDIICRKGKNYFIDVNATSNYAEDDILTNGFNPLDYMAEEIISTYSDCRANNVSGK